MDNNKHIDELIRKGLENYSHKPTARVWENIAASGINDNTSSATSTQSIFNKNNFRLIAITIVTIASIAIFISPTPYKAIGYERADQINYFRQNTSKPIPSNTGNGIDAILNNIQTQNTGITNFDEADVSVDNISSEITTTSSSGNNVYSENPVFAANEKENVSAEVTLSDINSAPSIETITPDLQNSAMLALEISDHSDPVIPFENNTISDVANSYQLHTIETSLPNLNTVIKGFYTGVGGGYNFTTIVENNPVGWDNSPIESTAKYGSVSSLSAGYNFNQYFGIQVDYNINSNEGTNYALNSDYSKEKTLQLRYNQIPVTFRFILPQMNYLTNRLQVTNLYAGIQYNALIDYHLPQEQRYETADNAFKESTISFVAGIDYDIYVTPRIFFRIGARGTYSSEIATENYPISDNPSHSVTVGGRAALSYKFSSNK